METPGSHKHRPPFQFITNNPNSLNCILKKAKAHTAFSVTYEPGNTSILDHERKTRAPTNGPVL